MNSAIKFVTGLRVPNPRLMINAILDTLLEWPIVICLTTAVVLFVLDVQGTGGIWIASFSFILDLALIVMFSAATYIEYDNRFNYRQDRADAIIGSCVFFLVLSVALAVVTLFV